ncbi:VOC family protein [Shinella sp. S4-D37]|uniref:VOC family protein n=1 Tax=Shinella sp. S4-D37 TaxID=3161999 RepID=UPI003467151A
MLDSLDCHFHHLGVACRDIEQEARSWLRLGYKKETEIFVDPTQRVRGQFLVGVGPRLELLQSFSPNGTIAELAGRGIKIYHQAFETTKFEETVDSLRGQNCKLVEGPVPAVAFEGRRIAFLFMPNMGLIEIIEKDARCEY